MKLNKTLIAVAAAAVLLVAGLGGTVLAQTPTDPGDGWQQMYAYCHGGGSGVYFDRVTLNRIAKVLNVTPQELTSQLNSGKSVADVAQAQGVALEKVVDTLVAPYRDRLQVSVSYGYLTQEEADELVQQQAQWLTTRLSTATTSGSQTPYRGGMTGGWGGMMGGGMMGGLGGGFGRGAGGMMGGWR